MTGTVHLEVSECVAWVRLDHPSRFNAMTRSMWGELRAAFCDLQREPHVRCVVVLGEQDNFSAGGDISEYPTFRFDANKLRAFHEQEVWGALQAMLDCDLPLVAQIRGACMGAGLLIASCCDLRVADPTARFGAPIARLGFPMAPREAALVLAALGDATARSVLLAAKVFDAQTMLQRGFLTSVAASDALPLCTQALLEHMLALSPQAARLNKQTLRALRDGGGQTMAPHTDPYAYAASPQHREGIEAFLAKRPPVFSDA